MVIDLNADVGESFGSWRMGDDAALLPLVSSANVACGFHAGDASTARRAVEIAVAAGVSVGAHVGYQDLAGFGRRFLDIAPRQLTDEVIYQVGALDALARTVGGRVRFVKPHGALYHAIVRHPEQAAAVVAAVQALDLDLALVTLPGALVAGLAQEAGVRIVLEAFADRAYTADGGLVPRDAPGAVLGEPEEIAARVVGLARDRTVSSVDGGRVTVEAETVCLHGDSPGAVAIARAVRTALDAAGIAVASPL